MKRRVVKGAVVGLCVLVGGSTYFATAGYAADSNVGPIAQGLKSFSDSLSGLNGLEELADPVAFTGLLPTGSDGLALANVFTQSLSDKLSARLTGAGFDSVGSLQSFLNDPDAVGGDSDDGTFGGVAVDIGGTVTNPTSDIYNVSLTLHLSRGGTTPLSLPLPAVNASGGALTKGLDLNASLTFQYDASLPVGSKLALLTATPQTLTANLDVDLGATAYDVNLGLTKVSVSGTADIGAQLVASLVDPTPDGRITADDWQSTAALDLFEVGFGASHANLSLNLASDIPGVPTGTVSLADTDLSTGIGSPTVTLGTLGDFKNMTPVDFLGGLANVAGALDALQLSGPADLKLPLLKDRLSEVLVVNQRLKNFFTTTGLSAPATPLTIGPGPGVTPAAYAASLASVDTLQELRGPLALALGIPVNLLGFAFDPNARRLTLTIKKNETRGPLSADVDLANQLERLGVVDVADAASSVTLTPTVDLDLGVSVDLTPRTGSQGLLDKISIDTAGVELAVDAPVTANLDMVGRIGFLGLGLQDSNAGVGTVSLLGRKVAANPMLSVDIDGGTDNLMSLSELFAVAAAAPTFSGPAGSIAVAVNAAVPSFDLLAKATAGGSDLANGTVHVAWPDITSGAPVVTADTDFNTALLDFDFDHSNPLALFTQVTTALTTFADAIDALSEQAAGEVLSRDLPFAGQSFDDLANKLSDVSAKVNALIADPPATLQVLETRLETALGEALAIPVSDRGSLLGVSVPSGAGPTTIVFDLSYGLCSAAGVGCNKVTGPLSLPFNFDLGASTGGIVGVDGGGEVALDYKALASLDFGVELPAVTAGVTNGSLPTVSGSPSAFVVDTSMASLSANLTAGGNLTATVGPIELSLGIPGDPIEAKLAAGITLDNDIALAGATRIPVPSADFTSFVTGLIPTDIGPADRVTCAAVVGGPFDACATIPVYDGTTLLGTIKLSWADLTQLSGADGPQLTGADGVFNALIAKGLDFTKILQGMQKVLVLVTDSLKGASYGEKLPIIGDALDAGANVADLFNTEIVTPLSTFATELSGLTDPGAIRARIQQFFVDALALPGGDSLLKNRPGSAAGPDVGDVVVTVLCDDGVAAPGGDLVDGEHQCTADNNALHLSDVQIGFAIGQVGATGTPVNFDLGIPGLRLEMTDDPAVTTDNLQASATWELDLAFGLSIKDGFYLRTDNPNNIAGSPTAELVLGAGLELPDNLNGDIAFLPFTLTDRTNPATPADPKDLNLNLGVDIKGGGARHRLAFTDLVAGIDPADDTAVDIALGGNVNIDVHFVTGPFGTEDSSVPTFVADFLLAWDFNASTLDGATGNLKIEFNNVGIDLGSLIGDFLAPILKEASRITKPLKPVVDIVTAPIPGLTDAAAAFGCPLPLPFPEIIANIDLCKLSLLDVYEKQSGTDLTLIRQLITLVNFINAVDSAGTQPMLTLGSFKLNAGTALAGPLSGNDKFKLLDNASFDESALPKPLANLVGAIKNVVANVTKDGADKGGFTFPAFDDPSRLFKMLLGQDVTLITWDAGSLEAAVTIPLEIGPPIGPLPISLGITIQFGVRGHFAVGYDTKGIRKAVERLTNDDPSDDGFLATVGTLFAGIGIDDRLRVNGEPTGEDIPEITLFGSVVAKAALDLLIVEAGVRGGVAATLNANLHDGGVGPANHTDPADRFSHHPENLDGVLRLDEIASGLGNPLCLFDYDGKITAFLEAYIDYTLDEETFTIVGPVTLYDFSELLNQACQTVPVLAHVDGDGNLVLHLGAFADQRDFQEDVENERFVVRQLDGAGTAFSVTAFGYTQDYSGVSGIIFGDGGSGTDTITLEPGALTSLGTEPPATGPPGDTINSTVVPFTRAARLCGGPGIDVLSSGSGADVLVGDGVANKPALTCSTGELGTDGVDDLTAGPGDDTLYGTGGADKLKGGDGGDAINGGTGSDVILGGPGEADGKDIIRGGPDVTGLPDADTIFASDGDDEVDGGADKDAIEGDNGADKLRGGPGDDTIQGRSGNDLIEGQGDNDVLYGSDGDDDIRGGTGDDDLFGESGDDLLSGGADEDDLIGGRDNTGVGGDTSFGDLLNGDAGIDYLLGDEGTIARPAGSDNGTITCAGTFVGDDTLNGGADADVLFGCAGADLMHGNNGPDLVYGGDGNDNMFGDDGPDMMYGDLGSDVMSGGAGDDNPMRGGDGNDTMTGDAGLDTMFGDSGDDLMKGNADDDTIRGGIGTDTMEGNGASDTMYGDDGPDLLIGGTSTAAQPDAGDVMYGGLGEDVLVGDNGTSSTLFDLDSGNATYGGKDFLDGGPDNDRAYGGLDDDQVYGGDGQDQLEGNNASDDIYGQGGADNIIGGTSQRAGGTASYPDEGDHIWGGDADDVVLSDNGSLVRAVVGAGSDVTQARGLTFERTITLYDLGYAPDPTKAGDDTVHGDGGTDVILGQGEVDTLHGDAADDFVAGGQAGDTLYGEAGQDDLLGGSYELVGTATGQDRDGQLDGGDTVYGGGDGDILVGDNGSILRNVAVKSDSTKNRTITERTMEIFDLGDFPNAGTSGNDWLLGQGQPDVILGQSGTDRITSGGDRDYAEGGPDSDWIEGNDGRDDLVGGSSTIMVGTSGRTAIGQKDAADVIWGGADDDLVIGDNAVVDRLHAADELTRRIGTNPVGLLTDGRFMQLLDLGGDIGSAGTLNSLPTGRFGADFLSGQDGVDLLLGQDGNDEISGGSADDYAEGQGGDDTLRGDDDIVPSLSLSTWPGDASPGYTADTGDDGQDELIGGTSERGFRDGGDTVFGNGQSDFVLGDNGTAVRVIQGTDSLVDKVYALRYAAAAASNAKVRVADSDFASTRFCNAALPACEEPNASGPDVIQGDGGDDFLYGQDDADTIRGGNQDDDIYGELGNDLLFGEAGDDAILGDRGGVRDRYETGANTPPLMTVNQVPKVEYQAFPIGSVTRIVDLLHDVDGDAFVGAGAGARMPHNGLTEGGKDRIRGGADNDAIHAGFGDDLANGDSGGDSVFGDDGGDVLWGGKGCDASLDTKDSKPVCFVLQPDGTYLFDPAPHNAAGETRPEVTDYLLGGIGGTSTTSLTGANGSDLLDWRPRGSGTAVNGCTNGEWPVDLKPADKKGITTTVDPCSWFAMTNLDNLTDADNQHHQGVDWQYGGWDRDVLQGDVADNGPNEGDRLLDWNGTYNLYTHCNSAYGGFNDVRQHSPAWQLFLQRFVYGEGAGQAQNDASTGQTSAFVELALVYPGADNAHGSGSAYPATPGHFDNPNACGA